MNAAKLLVAGSVVLLLAQTIQAQEAQPNAAELQKAFEAYAKPGEPHEQLKRLVGTWKTETKSYYPDPSNPSASEGSAKFTMVLGGRFVQQEFKGEFGGQKFEGIGFSGYDNAKKKFVGTWMDDMGTGIMQTEGTYDEKTHTLTETGSASSPLGEMKMRLTSQYKSDDEFVFTMYMTMPQGEQKMMEITYTRAKK